jgi:hypothetical protein
MPLTRRVRASDEYAERRSVPLHCDRVPIDDLDGGREARPAVTRLVHGPWERLLRTPGYPLRQIVHVVGDLRLLLVEALRVAGLHGRGKAAHAARQRDA